MGDDNGMGECGMYCFMNFQHQFSKGYSSSNGFIVRLLHKHSTTAELLWICTFVCRDYLWTGPSTYLTRDHLWKIYELDETWYKVHSIYDSGI